MDQRENAALDTVVHTAPFRVVDSQGRTLLEVTENGEFSLVNPATGRPVFRIGAFTWPEASGPEVVHTPAFGLELFHPDGQRVIGLGSTDLNAADEEPEYSGRMALFGQPTLPGVDLWASPNGDGNLDLMAPAPGCPDHIGISLDCMHGEGIGRFRYTTPFEGMTNPTARREGHTRIGGRE